MNMPVRTAMARLPAGSGELNVGGLPLLRLAESVSLSRTSARPSCGDNLVGQVIRKNYPVAIGNRMDSTELDIASVVDP
jgi:hypothetical protein